MFYTELQEKNGKYHDCVDIYLRDNKPKSPTFRLDHEWFSSDTNPDYAYWQLNIEKIFQIKNEKGFWVFNKVKPNILHLAVLLARQPLENTCLDPKIIRELKKTLELFDHDPLKCFIYWIRESKKNSFIYGQESCRSHGLGLFAHFHPNITPEDLCIHNAIKDLEKTNNCFNDAWRVNDCIGLVSR